jgi:hypothetical protein
MQSFDKLKEWLNVTNDAIYMFEKGSRGLYSKKDIKKNDVIMRIRIKQDSKGSFLEFMKDFEKQLIELPLRGISNINQVEIAESNIIKYNDEKFLKEIILHIEFYQNSHHYTPIYASLRI